MTLQLPNTELQILIRQEVNEDVNTRDRDVAIIKNWLRQEPHLPDTWDEICLLSFLRGCKFSLEKCKKKLDMYFTLKAAVPEFYRNRNLQSLDLMDVIDKTHVFPLPNLTPDGKRVVLLANSKEYDFINYTDIFKYITMIADIRFMAEKYGVRGDVYLLDAKLQLLKPFLKMSPVAFKKFFIFLQDACAVRIKEIHIINPTPVVNVMYNTVKPFLKEKLKSRIHFHSTLETLYDFVPRDVLPVEYGGTCGKTVVLKNNWIEEMEEYKEWFEKQKNVMANEEKRCEKIDYDTLFGVEGSFKQLTID